MLNLFYRMLSFGRAGNLWEFYRNPMGNPNGNGMGMGFEVHSQGNPRTIVVVNLPQSPPPGKSWCNNMRILKCHEHLLMLLNSELHVSRSINVNMFTMFLSC